MIDSKRNDIIRTALESGLNFFCYRFPGECNVRFGCSRRTLAGIHENSFLISPFDNSPEGIISIPADFSSEKPEELPEMKFLLKDESEEPLFQMPHSSTCRARHKEDIEYFQKIIDGHDDRKIIATRKICDTSVIDISESFNNLLGSYPNAFIFIFYTPKSGLWMGASPELLLRGDSSGISTMSLAGTRETGSDEKAWDKKDIYEQKIVTDYIVNTLLANGLDPLKGETFTKKAGPVEHICTEIKAASRFKSFDELISLLADLSPTPALNGFPKDIAMSAIKKREGDSRAYYGGFAGWVGNTNDFRLFVNLRSVRISSDGWCAYVGGGITARSVADNEWKETEFKAKTLLEKLKFIEKR